MTGMTKTHLPAAALLALMASLMIGSVWHDAATVDELAHIPSGFGYITKLDYRLNPEHPPLIKAIAALSARLAVHPYFPTETVHWRDEVNSQWSQGGAFLYGFGNDADRIIFWSRVPLILLTVLFAWLFYAWTNRRFGRRAALFVLVLLSFSPTMLAHGRLVTTDMGAAFGFFIGIASFIAFLERPDGRRIALAGAFFGIAQLLKFSVVLLVPIYAALLLAWVAAQPHLYRKERLRALARLAGKTVLIFFTGAIVISLVYGMFVWNYPRERQLRDAQFLLGSYGFRPAVELDVALMRHPLTRGFGEYMLGFLMVHQRSQGGNTAYFLGQVSAAGSRWYFPTLYLFKEPLPVHFLTIVALGAALGKYAASRRARPERRGALRRWVAAHFAEFSALVFIAVYWAASLQSPLNIGVRHVLPTFPFIYLLVSRQIADGFIRNRRSDPADWGAWLRDVYETYIASIPRYLIVAALFVWLAVETVLAFPAFLSYYNQLAGGTDEGWRVAVDSNYDWGQDMKRLAHFVEENGISSITLDYFGGANPAYYLGRKFIPWQSARGPASGWFAISASTRQGAWGNPAPGFSRRPEDSYEWLKNYEPVARAGTSIFIYRLP